MARYVITGSKFKPFSYAELIQPIQLAEAAHQAVEDQYNELSTKANVWDKLAGEQPDSKVSTLYRDYANDLRNQANQLAKEGLTPSSRQGLLEMKSRYSTDIIPIEQAYNARAAEAAEQLAGKAKGIVYEGNASLSSLDRYLYNPQIRYGMADSQEGYKRVYNSAKALQGQLRNYGNGERLDYYTKTWLQEHGYKQDEANQAIKDIQEALTSGDNIRGNNILSDILAQEMNTSGVANWNNNAARVDYFNRVSPAIYAAVGETKVSPYEDYGRRLSARATESSSSATVPRVPWRAIPITRTNEQIRNTTQMKSDAEFLRELASNPSKALDVQKTYYPGVKGRGEPGSADINIAPGDVVTQSYMKRLSDISKKYGINVNFNIGDNGNNSTEGLIKAAEELESRIRKSAIRSTGYALTNTNFDLGSRILAENIRSRSQRANDDTGAFEIEDGKVKSKPSKLEDVIGYINKDAQIEFDPSLGVVLRGSIQDGKTYKTKSFLLDPEVIAGESINVGGRIYNRYQYLIDLINESIENNDVEAATAISTRLMEDLDSYFNSIAKTQGNTMSAKEEEAASYYRN